MNEMTSIEDKAVIQDNRFILSMDETTSFKDLNEPDSYYQSGPP